MPAPESRLRRWKARFADSSGSQMLEFAVVLPLLVVCVVGIFDFGQAFNTKQKLSNVTREAARFASALPTNDLDAIGTPASVTAIRDLVDSHLKAARLNDCGLAGQAGVKDPDPSLSWTYTATGSGCPMIGLVLKIDRSYSFPSMLDSSSSSTFNVMSTRVNLKYPYQWQFNRVIGLLTPGATYQGISQITTETVIPNID